LANFQCCYLLNAIYIDCIEINQNYGGHENDKSNNHDESRCFGIAVQRLVIAPQFFLETVDKDGGSKGCHKENHGISNDLIERQQRKEITVTAC